MNIFQKVTLKSLLKNRTRTLVTIIGIILSASMFTAVTTMVSSLSQYLIDSAIYNDGNWYGAGYELSAKSKDSLISDSCTKDAVSMELLGFAQLKKTANEEKPFLCVYGIQSDFTDMMPLHLTQGRLPKNSQELLLPEHLKVNGGISCAVKDSFTLTLGTRIDSSGNTLSNRDIYLNLLDDNNGFTEKFVPTDTRTYTVVGFYERPSFEGYDAPGYTALTIGDNSRNHFYNTYLLTKSGKNTVSLLEQMFEEAEAADYKMNISLLRYYGYSEESSFNRVIFRLGIILILIIMFGSIALIYNAFSISVSERTKQFGLLASIGATKRQLTGSVLFEALFLSIIGIPAGILAGLAGIGITLFLTRDLISNVLDGGSGYAMMRLSMIFGPAKEVSLKLQLSFQAVAIAALVSLLTVIISAYIPARRAMRKSAIDAIRQSDDISIRSRKVKTSRFTQKFFGFEGMIAAKNYKRSRKKYRATVISLFLSIVLFISASSFCAYLTNSARNVTNDNGYDIVYYNHITGYTPEELVSALSEAESVTDASYAARFYFSSAVNTSALSQNFRDYAKEQKEQSGENYQEYDTTLLDLFVIFLADDDFKACLKKENLPEKEYFNTAEPKAVIMDSLHLYQENEHKFYTFPAFTEAAETKLSTYLTETMEGYSYAGTDLEENGRPYCRLYHDTSDKELHVPLEDGLEIPFSIGAAVQEPPKLFPERSDHVQLFYPYSMMDHVFAALEKDTSYYDMSEPPLSENHSTELFFQCEDHNAAYTGMTNILLEKNLSSSSLYDYAASEESNRAMVNIINIFSYGFITLISLIAAANVFNTISTNINLRRREFAMLKSIGMTPESFRRMMNFECLLYGFKGLLYGLPVSVLVTFMIYRSVGEGLEMAFFIPWYSIAIAVGSVFLVVFTTMIYSMRRIRRENTIDALKNENL